MPEIIRRLDDNVAVVREGSGAITAAPSLASTMQRILYFVMSVLTALLLLRLVLSLLGANAANTFASFVYNASNPFVAPFRGLFGYQPQLGVARIEIETIVAIVVYLLIGWALINLFEIAKPRRYVAER